MTHQARPNSCFFLFCLFWLCLSLASASDEEQEPWEWLNMYQTCSNIWKTKVTWNKNMRHHDPINNIISNQLTSVSVRERPWRFPKLYSSRKSISILSLQPESTKHGGLGSIEWSEEIPERTSSVWPQTWHFINKHVQLAVACCCYEEIVSASFRLYKLMTTLTSIGSRPLLASNCSST